MLKEEIKKILPHREPMLLVEEIEVTADGTAVGKYTVKGDEFFLQGHFPDNPIVPGVIQLEMIAQTSVALITDRTEGVPVYTGIKNVRFKNQLLPGETAIMQVKITARKGMFVFAEGSLSANGKLCTTMEFSFAMLPAKEK